MKQEQFLTVVTAYVAHRIFREAARPATSSASLLSSTTKADGFFVLEQDSKGFVEGDAIEVWMYD
jgi:molybdopterin biosynthesis enzyme